MSSRIDEDPLIGIADFFSYNSMTDGFHCKLYIDKFDYFFVPYIPRMKLFSMPTKTGKKIWNAGAERINNL